MGVQKLDTKGVPAVSDRAANAAQAAALWAEGAARASGSIHPLPTLDLDSLLPGRHWKEMGRARIQLRDSQNTRQHSCAAIE